MNLWSMKLEFISLSASLLNKNKNKIIKPRLKVDKIEQLTLFLAVPLIPDADDDISLTCPLPICRRDEEK